MLDPTYIVIQETYNAFQNQDKKRLEKITRTVTKKQ